MADRIKIPKVDKVDINNLSHSDETLHLYQKLSDFGTLHQPATIVDQNGIILLWYLPKILQPFRLVCLHLSTLNPLFHFIFPRNKLTLAPSYSILCSKKHVNKPRPKLAPLGDGLVLISLPSQDFRAG